jgi:hypothetical protein
MRVLYKDFDKNYKYFSFLLDYKDSVGDKPLQVGQLIRLMMHRSTAMHKREIDYETIEYVLNLLFNTIIDLLAVGFLKIRFYPFFMLCFRPHRKIACFAIQLLTGGRKYVTSTKILAEDVSKDRYYQLYERQNNEG